MVGELAGQDVLVDLGAVAGALLAIGAAVGASLALLRRVLRAEIQPIVEQFTTNGGSTMKDAVNRVEERQQEQSDRLSAIEAALATGTDRMGSIERSVTSLEGAHDRHLAWHQAEAEQGGRVADALDQDLDDDGAQT